MPMFNYRARTLTGEEQRGRRDARDLPALGRALRDEGLLLIEAKSERGEAGRREIPLPFFSRVSLADRMMTTRHLAVLIEAGVDLPRGLSTLSRQAQSKKLKATLLEVADAIRRGQRFSESLRPYPKIFSELYVAMVAAGEESGKLVESLKILADQLEKQHKLQSRIRGAMMYPAVVLTAMAGIGVAMFIFVVPQLESVFGDIKVALPPQTRFIFWLSHALVSLWYAFVGGALLFAIFLRVAWQSKTGRKARYAFLMRAPVFKRLLREIASAQLARTLSSLVSAGVPIVRALEITSRVVGNEHFRVTLIEASRMVEKGKSVHEIFAQYPWVYPPLVVEMAAVGEESGKFSEVFADLAAFYEDEVDQRTQTLSTIVEPILMIIIGVLVGFFVISMMQPMYSLIGTL